MSETDHQNMQLMAENYVTLAAHIKEKTAALTTQRKNLKKLDEELLGEMRKCSIMELSVNGVVIQRTTKLQLK